MVESCHAPLQLAYWRISADKDRHTSNQEGIHLAGFPLNCSVELDGTYPALLVRSSIPRLVKMKPAPSQTERAKLVDRVMD